MNRTRLRELALLVASAGIVGAGVAVHEVRSSSGAPSASVDATPRLSDLPSGAPLPSDTPPVEVDRGCDIADRGNGDYVEKGPLPMGRLFVRPGAVDPSGDYTLLLHLHGGDAARKLVLPEALDVVMVVIDRGIGSSAYEGTFPSRRSFDELVGSVDRLVSEASSHPAHAQRIVVSSWSAGYRGVEDVLHVVGSDPELFGIILMDSLHASYPEGTTKLAHGQLAPFVEAARRASHDQTFFFHLTHSEIKPPGYASTTETASLLLSETGVQASAVNGGRDLVPLTRMAEQGHFVVRGYAGNDARAHCDQLRLLPSILAAHGLR